MQGTVPPTFAPSSLAQWFGAAGTIAAVILALFKDPILAWRRKPRLEATSDKETPSTVRMPTIVHDGRGTVLWSGECYFVRVKVENTGRSRAEKVQVGAIALAKRGLDNKFEDVPTILPLNMRWANSPPTGATVILDGISPRMSAFCDVVSLCDPANPHQKKPADTPAGTTVGQLQLEVEPFADWNLLPPGAYRLTLRIAAANAEPVDKILVFEHKGNWLQNDADMRRDCLAVSLE